MKKLKQTNPAPSILVRIEDEEWMGEGYFQVMPRIGEEIVLRKKGTDEEWQFKVLRVIHFLANPSGMPASLHIMVQHLPNGDQVGDNEGPIPSHN